MNKLRAIAILCMISGLTACASMHPQDKLILAKIAARDAGYAAASIPGVYPYCSALCAATGLYSTPDQEQAVLKQLVGQVWQSANEAKATAVALAVNDVVELSGLLRPNPTTGDLTVWQQVFTDFCAGVRLSSQVLHQ